MRIAATFLAITGIGVLLAASDGTARPMGRPAGFHPAIGAARPLAAGPRAAFHARSAARLHAGPHARLHHRGRSGFGLWPYGYGDGYYPPESYQRPYPPYLSDEEPPPVSSLPRPAPAPVIQVINVIPYRPGCDTEVEQVPWRNGSEKSIRIVRC